MIRAIGNLAFIGLLVITCGTLVAAFFSIMREGGFL